MSEGSSFEPAEEAVSSVDSTLSLTSRQMLVWIESVTHPGIPLNTVTTLIEINGRIDPDRLVQAFSHLVDRHEALRATIEVQQGMPELRISEQGDDSLEVVDLTDSDDREKALLSVIKMNGRVEVFS